MSRPPLEERMQAFRDALEELVKALLPYLEKVADALEAFAEAVVTFLEGAAKTYAEQEKAYRDLDRALRAGIRDKIRVAKARREWRKWYKARLKGWRR